MILWSKSVKSKRWSQIFVSKLNETKYAAYINMACNRHGRFLLSSQLWDLPGSSLDWSESWKSTPIILYCNNLWMSKQKPRMTSSIIVSRTSSEATSSNPGSWAKCRCKWLVVRNKEHHYRKATFQESDHYDNDKLAAWFQICYCTFTRYLQLNVLVKNLLQVAGCFGRQVYALQQHIGCWSNLWNND